MASKRPIIIYVVLPLAVGALLLGLYFSRVAGLQRLVSPKLPPLPENTWREYGLLENLQNALLLTMIAVAVRGAARARLARRRRFLVALALLAAFVLLEETDYGSHAWRWFTAGDLQPMAPESTWSAADREASARHAWFNLHTGGRRFRPIKRVVDGAFVVFFVVLPLVASRLFPDGSPAWVPSRWMAAAAGTGGLVRVSAHALGRWELEALDRAVGAGGLPWEIGSISSNLSEFGELFLYYGGLLYLIEQVGRSGTGQSEASLEAGRL